MLGIIRPTLTQRYKAAPESPEEGVGRVNPPEEDDLKAVLKTLRVPGVL
jgi:hypothetical protein